MKRDRPGDPRLPGQQPGLEGGQVRALAGPFPVCIEKSSLDKEVVGSTG